ncbi:unnamed protein product [Cylindrotheca closterium]|uniref:Uncharacterized protein n=1 Tax=Cylindrotheca closterium TaxID=2856 RepID=A0AAD2CRI7_9STRA|nr:unnamed protein product [Cylindrotheca closterium]
MMNSKVYKKTKVVETSLATVQIESEVYETKPVTVGEGPPRWLKNIEPSQQNPEAKRETDQRQHMNLLFKLGQKHQSSSFLSEEKSAGSGSSDERRSREQLYGGTTIGVHRSTRHLDVSSASDDLSKQQKQPEPEDVRKDAAETYLGISLRDISNKFFMTQNCPTDGVEETKEGEEDAKRDSRPSLVGFDIGKVIPKNLLESIQTIPAMSFYGSNRSSDEAPLNDPVNGKAPLFTEEMREKQLQSLVPLDEIRIIDPCEACRVDLTTVEDGDFYLRRTESDEMSCVTIPNMNAAS